MNEWAISCFFKGGKPGGIEVLDGEGTLMRPFWREAGYEFDSAFWEGSGLIDAWHVWQDISPDRFLDPAFLQHRWPEAEVKVLLNRVDTRTYEELPVLVQLRGAADGTQYVTTLRFEGGLGIQPYGLRGNPAAHGVLGWLSQPIPSE